MIADLDSGYGNMGLRVLAYSYTRLHLKTSVLQDQLTRVKSDKAL